MTVIKTDTFTEASDTPLESHSSDVGGGWDGAVAETTGFDIRADDDEVHRASSGGRGWAVGDEDPTADYWVEINAKTGGTSTNDRIAVAVRHDGVERTTHTSYNGLLLGSGSWSMNKIVGGSNTNLGSGSIGGFSAATYYDLKIQADGTTIKFFIDDVEVASVTDSSISAAGNVGIYIRNANARITSFTSEDLAGGAVKLSYVPIFRRRGRRK